MKKESSFFVLSVFIGFLSMINFSACKKKELPAPADQYVYVPVPAPSTYPINLGNGWEIIARIGNISMVDLMFLDEMRGYASAIIDGNKRGAIYKTVDGGKRWNSLVLPTEFAKNYFYNMYLIDDNTYLVPDSGLYLLKITSDSIFNKIIFDQPIFDVQFVNVDTGYVIGKKMLYWTSDGGKKWDKLIFTNNTRTGSTALYFNKQNRGMVILDSLYSIDMKTRKIVGLSMAPEGGVTTIQFYDDKYVFLGGRNHILGSTDGGVSFSRGEILSSNNYTDLYMPGIPKGFLSNSNRILISVDTGKTWRSSLLISDAYFSEIDFLNENLGWACSSNGKIYKYKN